MKKLLFLVLLSASAVAQNIPAEINYRAFPQNPIEKTIRLDAADSAVSVAVTVYANSETMRRLPADLQPAITRSGRDVQIRWSGTQSEKLQTNNFVQIQLGSIVKFAGVLQLSKTSLATPPNSVTVINQIVAKGDKGDTGAKGDTGDPATNLVTKVAGRQGEVQLIFADLVAHPSTVSGYGITDAYTKTQTYSQSETDAKKADLVVLGTFSEAQAQSQAGKPKVFILTSDAAYGGSSVVIWSGSSYTVIPGIPRTN
jgi:hypothetical protein